ncbi:MAG: addiction module protein [Deltaproteobacteria bacterium]|nr:addiction module protein [Deltaproteobacteria bacterium]
MKDTNEFISIAESLPIDLKTRLIDRLLGSLQPSQAEIDALWAKEAERRIEEVKTIKKHKKMFNPPFPLWSHLSYFK